MKRTGVSTTVKGPATPAGDEHRHRAGVNCFMSHLAILEGVQGGDGTTWLEPVTDEQYGAADAGADV